MLYIPVNEKSFGSKPIKGGVITLGDKYLSFTKGGGEICQAVLMEGDSSLKQDGLTYALRFPVGYKPQYVEPIKHLMWELMEVMVTEDDIVGYCCGSKWSVVTKKGLEASAPIVCEDFREAYQYLPSGNTAEAPSEPVEASEGVSKDEEGTPDNEGAPDKATHYKGAVEPLEVMAKIMTKEEFIGFLKGNIIKYSYRAGRKQGESGEKDRNKFTVYSDWLAKVTNGEPIELGDKIITIK